MWSWKNITISVFWDGQFFHKYSGSIMALLTTIFHKMTINESVICGLNWEKRVTNRFLANLNPKRSLDFDQTWPVVSSGKDLKHIQIWRRRFLFKPRKFISKFHLSAILNPGCVMQISPNYHTEVHIVTLTYCQNFRSIGQLWSDW